MPKVLRSRANLESTKVGKTLMITLWQLIYCGIVIGILFRTVAFLGAITVACIIVMALPSRSLAQEPLPLTKTLKIEVEGMGITILYPEGWSAAQDANVYKLLNVPAEEQDTLDAAALDKIAQIMIFTEHRIDHAEAVRRLKEIDAETDSPSIFLNIGGWPALQRRHLAPKPQPGQDSLVEEPGEMVLVITTAIAADSLLVRLEGRLRPDAPPEISEQIEAIGQSLVFTTTGDPRQVEQEIEDLSSKPAPRSPNPTLVPETPSSSEDVEASEISAGAPVRVTRTGGTSSELEVAVSTDGQNIVIGSNFGGFSFSTDGGRTFNLSAGIFGNDPSVAFGPSGTFYAANIGINATAVSVSTDNGANFNFRANAFTCPAMGPNVCPGGIPDQEHIAADRFNAAPGGDQVYSAWRHLDGRYGIVCTADSGMTWSTANFTAGDFPRITLGQDGFVYVVYKVSSTEIMLNKYKSCQDNPSMLPEMGFPTLVTKEAQDDVCPIPGLDRCGGKNVLNGPMVAVDDKDDKHIYVTYAVNAEFDKNTSLGNDNVVVQDSTDGGKTWKSERRVTVSGNIHKGRRFMPWVCAVDGTAHVSWYDRRAATAANNDLTDYFRVSAFLNNEGNLVASTVFQVNAPGTADPQCAIGWPGGVFSPSDSESCSVQPQLAGFCSVSGGTRCDFSDAMSGGTFGCPAGETCIPGGGQPKYGDYNGNACAAGRLYLAWASATPPALGGIDIFFALESPFRSDLSFIEISDSPDPVTVGDELTYNVTFRNNGPDVAVGVIITVKLPTGVTFVSAPGCTEAGGTVTCSFGNIGESTNFGPIIKVKPTAAAVGTITTTATATAQDPDPNTSDNTGTEDTTVNPTCAGMAITMGCTVNSVPNQPCLGTIGNDVIEGTTGPDVIHGSSGSDTINGLAGNDIICGGEGNDTLNGGTGRDRLFGQKGADTLNGNSENDLLYGGIGGDALNGHKGDDYLVGSAGDDSCDGGAHINGDTASGCENVTNVP